MALEKAQRDVKYNPLKKFENKGDCLKGYFKGIRETVINDSPVKVHTYLTAEGAVDIMGQGDILYQFKKNNITEGTYVEITYTGKKEKTPKGKFPIKRYDIEFDRVNRDDSELEGYSGDEEDIDDLSGEEPVPLINSRSPSADNQARVQAMLAQKRRA